MHGLPDETKEDLQMTKDFIKKNDRLRLKEIIVATIEKNKVKAENNNQSVEKFNDEYLAIHHCYLLVYEKVKQDI